ncbi:hypothetical protein O7632_12065 [Solwaraspora sp. WMMD406]|uniref:hypothetical protein n=1 Tax=Solwaraspora sp. WMMD406 TaxID=3016095 RepID=UPI00241726EF|nr:hypothetical protein [Solwaraspora sp. WMMD406]MDG4764828.1 hypothetical protein [Solwaraspora sp. WMMD406]
MADDVAEDQEYQPLYARVLRLRHVHPSGLSCLMFFEGGFVFGGLLALAELIPWWGLFVLPVAIAGMVKINDVVAGAVSRSAALVPEREQELFRREVAPAVGWRPRPVVPVWAGATATCDGGTAPGIEIRRLGRAHTESTAAHAALTGPTVFLETVAIGPVLEPAPIDPATVAALGAPTVILDVLAERDRRVAVDSTGDAGCR